MCVFKPNLYSKYEPIAVNEVKGMDKFVERQKMATEIKSQKEKLLNKNNGKRWVRKTTVPKEFSLKTMVNNKLIFRKEVII